jgi:antitoxin CptB
VAGHGTGKAVAHDEALRRLRWRSRRGLLENDLILTRFLDRYETELDRSQRAAFKLLLELPDNELLDLMLGRMQPQAPLDKPEVVALLHKLRSV